MFGGVLEALKRILRNLGEFKGLFVENHNVFDDRSENKLR